jgi:hypothetical protein
VAFLRICSGRLEKGARLLQVRTGKQVPVNAPLFFFAKDRQVAEEAWPGDVVGIANHGILRIGDTLTEGEPINFRGVPSFAPEHLRRVRLDDPMLAKKLNKALEQLADEGVVQIFRPLDGSPPVIGVVGLLQVDVLQSRLKVEYGVPAGFDADAVGIPALGDLGRSRRAGALQPVQPQRAGGGSRRRAGGASSPPTGGASGPRTSGRCCSVSTPCASSTMKSAFCWLFRPEAQLANRRSGSRRNRRRMSCSSWGQRFAGGLGPFPVQHPALAVQLTLEAYDPKMGLEAWWLG